MCSAIRWQSDRMSFKKYAISQSRICYLVFIGQVLQLTAMLSSSFVLVARFKPHHCSNKPQVDSPTNPDCEVVPYRTDEIARAGLWTVCYRFPHEEEGHTDPYCALFAEDLYQVEGLAMLQLLCVLSFCLASFGLLLLLLIQMKSSLQSALSSVAYTFLVIAGLCGLATCVYTHLCLIKEYLVYYDPDYMILYKWWGFHFFLDGSIIYLAAWVLYTYC